MFQRSGLGTSFFPLSRGAGLAQMAPALAASARLFHLAQRSFPWAHLRSCPHPADVEGASCWSAAGAPARGFTMSSMYKGTPARPLYPASTCTCNPSTTTLIHSFLFRRLAYRHSFPFASPSIAGHSLSLAFSPTHCNVQLTASRNYTQLPTRKHTNHYQHGRFLSHHRC